MKPTTVSNPAVHFVADMGSHKDHCMCSNLWGVGGECIHEEHCQLNLCSKAIMTNE